MIRVVLVYDAGPDAGMGHRRRMEALAAALDDLGAVPELREATGGVVEADVVVVDSYRRRADDPGQFRAGVVVALDDLGRDLAVDTVVDPSPGSRAMDHTRARRVLAGPTYALTDPALAHLRPRPVGDAVGVALVATGGGATAATGAIVAAELSGLLPKTEVRVAVPPGAPAPAAPLVEVSTTAGLGPALADADLVVTAAGVTLLEALALGRPTVALPLAANQQRAALGAAAAGAAVLADAAGAAAAAASLAANPAARQACARAAVALVDSRGAHRVAAAVLGRG